MKAQSSSVLGKKIRVLHVIPDLGSGGIQSWLVSVLKILNPDRFQHDIVIHRRRSAPYLAEVLALGARVFHCPLSPRYAENLRRVLRTEPPYDVMHAHCDPGGFPLRVAQQENIPVRVFHGHLDRKEFAWLPRPWRWLASPLARHWIQTHATGGIAVSEPVAAAKFGFCWRADPRWRVLHCGIPLEPVRERPPSSSLRSQLGIAEGAFVLGHVGRLHRQKNHRFLFEIAAQLRANGIAVRVLLVGEGDDEPALRRYAEKLLLSDTILWAGARNDVRLLMETVIDALVLPSLYEGLPLVALEAQASGLPVFLPRHITAELVAFPALVHRRLCLRDSAQVWAAEIAAHAIGFTRPGSETAQASVKAKGFSIESSARRLADYYEQCLQIQAANRRSTFRSRRTSLGRSWGSETGSDVRQQSLGVGSQAVGIHHDLP